MDDPRIPVRATLRTDDASAIGALRTALDSAHYRLEQLRPSVLGAARADRTDTLAILIRLFFLRLPVSDAEADAALQPLGLAKAVDIGVVHVEEGRAFGTVELLPEQDNLFASDGDVAEPQPDHVMSPAGSSTRLAALTSRQPVKTALDLGCGCGYQAILAARHAEHVVATDLNPRAAACTAFNAALNRLTNVECRVGDWLSALEPGGVFDLVVCNPPYVIAPASSVLFREDPIDSGGSSRTLVQRAPDLLAPGGVGVLLVGWTHTANQHWADPLTAWLDARCDAWLLRASSSDPPTYAATWNAHLSADRERYIEAVERWTNFFARRGVERLAEGAVALRRRTAPGRSHVRYADLPPKGLDVSAGDDLATRLAMSVLLEEMDDATFSRRQLDVAPNQRLEQTSRYVGGRFHLQRAALVGEAGLQSRFSCTALLLRLLAVVDGQRTVGQVVELAAGAEVRDSAIAFLREGVAFGALRLT